MGFVGSNKSTDWYQPQPRSHSHIQYRQQLQCLNVQFFINNYNTELPKKITSNQCATCMWEISPRSRLATSFFSISISIGPILNQTTMEVGEFSSESPILSAVTCKQRRCVVCQHWLLCNDAIIKKKTTCFHPSSAGALWQNTASWSRPNSSRETNHSPS